MVTPRPAWLTRRRFLLGAGTAVGVGAAAGAGVGIDRALAGGPAAASAVPDVELAAQPAGLPARQHAWTAYLATDRHGNSIPPQFDRLLFFDVDRHPHAGLRPAARGGAAHPRADLPVDAVRAAVHRRLGAGLLHRRAPRRAAHPTGQAALGLRAARDRRLPPLPAPRLRRRDAAGRGRGRAHPRHAHPALHRRRRAARHLGRAAVAGDADRVRRRRPARRAAEHRRHPRRPARPGRRAAVHGVQIGPEAEPGDRGRRDDSRTARSPAVPRCTPAICDCGWTPGTPSCHSGSASPACTPRRSPRSR